MILGGLGHLRRAAGGLSPNARLYLAGTFLMGLGQGAQAVHLNLYLRSLGVGVDDIGWVLSAASLGLVAASLPAAMWVDRFRAESVFLLAAAGSSAACLAMLLFPFREVLLGASFLSGMLYAVHWVAAAPFFMRNATEGERTELFGLSAALETLAMTISALGAGYLAGWLGGLLGSEAAGLKWALVAAAGASLAAVLPFSRIRSAPQEGAARGWLDYLRSPSLGLILRLSLPGFLVGYGAGLTIPFLNLYFRNRFGKSPADIGLYYAVANVLTMAGFLAGPILARRFGHVRAIVATELLSIPFFFILAVADRPGVAVAAFWMRGALMNMNQPVSAAFAMEVVPPQEQAAANSVRTFAWNLSWMASTAAGGHLIEARGHAPGMFVTMGLYLVAASCFWAFFGRRRGG